MAVLLVKGVADTDVIGDPQIVSLPVRIWGDWGVRCHHPL
jgi:hypothetical protein